LRRRQIRAPADPAVGPLPVQVVGAAAECERHRAGFQRRSIDGVVGQPFETEQAEIAGVGGVGIDESAHRRVHPVGADEHVGAGAAAVGEMGRNSVRPFIDVKQFLAVVDSHARLLRAVA
jgi:hypothetical protein